MSLICTLSQIVVPAIVDETDAADVDRLLADADFPATDVDVAASQGIEDLREAQVVAFELVWIEFHFELLGRPTPAVDLDDAGEGQQPPAHDPVLNGAQVRQPEMRGSHHLVAVDLSGGAVLLDRRCYPTGQIDILL